MFEVVENRSGQRVKIENLKIARKTGTAQFFEHGDKRNLAWLACFGPADNPQRARPQGVDARRAQETPDDRVAVVVGAALDQDRPAVGGRSSGAEHPLCVLGTWRQRREHRAVGSPVAQDRQRACVLALFIYSIRYTEQSSTNWYLSPNAHSLILITFSEPIKVRIEVNALSLVQSLHERIIP